MAQAGFYHQPNSSGDDRAMCFTCIVCLVCWEPTDEPWSEHERHSPSCPFVKGEYTQNVPLSVTYATAPAIHTDAPMEVLGTSSVPELIPTASSSGNIIVWNCSRQLKIEATISVVSKSNIYNDLTRKKEAWADQDVVEIPLTDSTLENLVGVWSNQEVQVGAVSVVGGPTRDSVRPVVVVGVGLARPSVSPLVRAMNTVNQASSLAVDIMKVADNKPQEWQLHLVVYDFHYRGDVGSGGEGGSASKTLVSGTGTSASRQETANMYPDIFLSKFLYAGPMLHDVDSGDVVYQTQDILVGENFPAPSSSSGMSCPVPLGVAVPTAGGGTFDTSMAINEGLDMANFPSTSNGSPPLVAKLLDRDSAISELGGGMEPCGGLLPQEPVPVQSVLVDTGGRDMTVTGLHPTRDGRHLLAVLAGTADYTTCGMLLLYRLNLTGPAVGLIETPICVKLLECQVVSVTLLPLEGDETGNPLGVAAIITQDGVLWLVDIATLEVKTTAAHKDGGRFVSVTYCNSLERVCAASEKGSLHFFTLRDEDTSKTEEGNYEDSLENKFYSPKQFTNKELPLLVNAPTLDLAALYELTRCENLVPCFAATVPGCWTELMQAQKQRKHPQHLQHADDVHHTRSWRLQNDLTSWDEHVFELTLPRSVCVGHVDLKFSLHAQCQYPPNLQFTLLKQNASGIGKLSDSISDVDNVIDFNLLSPEGGAKKGPTANPVLTKQFARTHNTEILSGPVNLAACLDLSDQSGTVTFTSPQLYKVRGRTLLVHIKALAASSSSIGQERERRWRWEHNGLGSSVDRLASNAANKKMDLTGCDWLHEISITVRNAKPTDIPNERAERCAMLESDPLVERLVELVTGENGVQQSMAFDILLWVVATRLSRLRPSPPQQTALVAIIQDHLGPLVHSCFVRGDRSTARKCVKLIVLCSDAQFLELEVPELED
ncbi:Baculoviral IAP repeat-containing protein 6 [Homalodisca vitripennis]|nr:Baculoviral IAP repeat-containing protein 6 [Homalodisca vitripennis]